MRKDNSFNKSDLYLKKWKPSILVDDLRENLKSRNIIIQSIRNFFNSEGLIEVETPILSAGGTTDIHLLPLHLSLNWDERKDFYLHTSPEYAMKRLICAGLVDIYQITKVFRDQEKGNKHNVEFSMLEWYSSNFSLDMMMQQVINLWRSIGDELCFNH